MLKNYLATAFRNLLKRRSHAAIVVLGLSIGLAAAILIFLYLRYETGYDAFHAKADRLARLALVESYSPQERFVNAQTPLPMGPAIVERFPEAVRFARVFASERFVRAPGSEALVSERCRFVDPDLLEMFTFPLARGDRATALRQASSVVLSPAAARRHFGDADPMGRALSVRIQGETFSDFTVTGVAAPVPENSSIRFDLLFPLDAVRPYFPPRLFQAWFNVNSETWLELRPGTDPKAFEARLEPVIGRLALGERYRPNVYVPHVQPLRTVHLDADFPAGIEPKGDRTALVVVGAIAVLLLAVACVNFVTLSIGRAAARAREVGVRKAAGASRGDLMRQFWGESFLAVVLSVVPAVALVQLALPAFRDLSGTRLTLDAGPSTIGFVLLLLLATGLGAGAYPAAVLSRFRPAETLTGRLRDRSRSGLRTALVLVQVGVGVFLVVCALAMGRQLRFLQAKDLGYKGAQVVELRTNGPADAGARIREVFAAEAARRPEVVGVAGSLFAFGDGWAEAGFTAADGNYREFAFNAVTPEFLDVMGIRVVRGRGFGREFAEADARGGIVVNRALERMFGWDDAVGKRLPGPRFPDHRIVGVVDDFHFESLHDPVRPLVLVLDIAPMQKGVENVDYRSSPQPEILVRVRPDDLPAAMETLRDLWRKAAPGLPFDAAFVDDAVDAMYRADRRLGRIVSLATGCAVLIAVLGLLGLCGLAVAKRTKEIGIRKVLGASAVRVTVLLSRGFLGLVLAANLLAGPAAALAIDRWLRGFAYRAPVGPLPFLAAAAASVVVALATIGFLVVRAARANPVTALRYE